MSHITQKVGNLHSPGTCRTAGRTVPSSRRVSWSTSSTSWPWSGPTPPATPGAPPTGTTSATWSSAMSSTGSCRSTQRRSASSSRLPGWTRWPWSSSTSSTFRSSRSALETPTTSLTW
ncbi:hypothetical protein CRUP_006830 [Coryphaenoides rupestris]|nr:hypothetical protein CRUP_006830 [Coryphaenoides rupestris]